MTILQNAYYGGVIPIIFIYLSIPDKNSVRHPVDRILFKAKLRKFVHCHVRFRINLIHCLYKTVEINVGIKIKKRKILSTNDHPHRLMNIYRIFWNTIYFIWLFDYHLSRKKKKRKKRKDERFRIECCFSLARILKKQYLMWKKFFLL